MARTCADIVYTHIKLTFGNSSCTGNKNLVTGHESKHRSSTLTVTADILLGIRQFCSNTRTYQSFMEPAGLLPCSQAPSTGPYPNTDQSSPYHHILSH
jgi:hypothetical protein